MPLLTRLWVSGRLELALVWVERGSENTFSDAFSTGTDAQHPQQERSAAHCADGGGKGPSRKAQHVADNSSEECGRRLLHETHERGSRARVIGKWSQRRRRMACGIASPNPA